MRNLVIGMSLGVALLLLCGCDSKPPVTSDSAPAPSQGGAVADRKSLAHTKTTIVPLAAGQPGSTH